MAHHIEIGHAPTAVKLRRPWAVALLGLATLGIYSIVWYYKVNREMRDYGSVGGDADLARSKPARSVIAVTIGRFLIIPPLVSYVRMVGRLRRVERLATEAPRSGAGLIALGLGCGAIELATNVPGVPAALGLLGLLCYLAFTALVQARLNLAWAQGDTVVDNGASGTRDSLPLEDEGAPGLSAARRAML